MKKLLWFTIEQNELLNRIKALTGLNNSEVVREAMKYYAKMIAELKNDSEK